MKANGKRLAVPVVIAALGMLLRLALASDDRTLRRRARGAPGSEISTPCLATLARGGLCFLGTT